MRNTVVILSLFCLPMVFYACKERVATDKVAGSYNALQLMSQNRAYPHSDIPPDAFGKAFEAHQRIRETHTPSREGEWEAMGPLNTAGRTLALAVDYTNPNTVYLGSASGGLWKSEDMGRGLSWQHVPTGFPTLGVSAIVLHPMDPKTMYIGTGEVYNYQATGTDGAYRSTRGSYGIGILKSTDGGDTWTKSLDWTYQSERGVQALAMAEHNSDVLYAATTHGIYKTENGGDTWTAISNTLMGTDVVIHSDDADVVIAAHGNLGSTGRGIYKTVNGGDSWTKATLPMGDNFGGKIELSALGDVVYASVGNGFTQSDGATWLLKSLDFGDTWSLVNTTDYSRWQGWFSHDVAIHPENADEIIAIGIDIWKSTDGGQTLSQKSSGGVTLGRPPILGPDGNAGYSHSDHHVVLYHPANPDIVLFGNDGGLFVSMDGGERFESRNGGLQTTQFYNGFSVSQQSTDFAMGGLQDNSTAVFRGDGAWQRAIGGDGSWSAIHFSDDNICFGSSQYLNIRRSVNRGNNFGGVDMGTSPGNALFIAPYIISPANPNRMYAGGTKVMVSDNQGQNWYDSSPATSHDPIFSMAASHQLPGRLLMGTAPFNTRSRVLISDNSGASWRDITGNLPDRFVNDVAFDPQNDAVIYAVFSGFGTGHLFKSTNRGNSWSDISGDLPDAPGNAIEVDPVHSDHLYYGNDLGIYFSPDGGLTWELFSEGISDAAIVLDLKVSPSDRHLWAATHGRGAFKRPLVDPISSTTQTLLPSLSLYPNPSSREIFLSIPERLEGCTYTLIAATGQIAQQGKLAGRSIHVANLPSGTYTLMVQSEEGTFSARFVKK